MKITAKLLRVGKTPEAHFIGEKGTLKVTFPAAENHNINKGTKSNPVWETRSTSWFNMEAWADTAQQILDELGEGDAFELKSGVHEIQTYTDRQGNEKSKGIYKVFDFSKYDS